jgi:V8-like Glu-specific endopeptidase
MGAKEDQLKRRAESALGNHQVADAVAKVRAIIGPQNIPDSEQAAQVALDKLRNGEIPTPTELAALEVVIRLLRPVVLSQNCALNDLPDTQGHNLYPQELKDLWTAFRTKINAVVCSIGRIETAEGNHRGTGFLVTKNLIATNRHVLGALTFGSEALPPNGARIVFKQESGLPNSAKDIAYFMGPAIIHPQLDIVLLKIPDTTRPTVSFDPAPATEGLRVVTIGYPGEDPVNNPLFLSSVYGGKYGVKASALGEVLDGTLSPTLFHDCSTTQGNSGSPVFSLLTARAVAIHRAGYFMYRNEAIFAEVLDQFIKANS